MRVSPRLYQLSTGERAKKTAPKPHRDSHGGSCPAAAPLSPHPPCTGRPRRTQHTACWAAGAPGRAPAEAHRKQPRAKSSPTPTDTLCWAPRCRGTHCARTSSKTSSRFHALTFVVKGKKKNNTSCFVMECDFRPRKRSDIANHSAAY